MPMLTWNREAAAVAAGWAAKCYDQHNWFGIMGKYGAQLISPAHTHNH